jgi:amidohydrolase
MYMASTDELYIKVKGKGGHGAQPHMNIDPVLIAAHIIIALQQIVSRNASPILPNVLSIGKVIANGATNIIPDEVNMEGTFRTFNEKWREEAKDKMKLMAESIATGMGGGCELRIEKGYPFLINNDELTQSAINNAKEYLGEENVEALDLWMAGEDFSYYSQQIPACFYRLGIRNKEKGIVSSVHTPTFDIDEAAIETGIGLMAWLAINELNAENVLY